MCYETPLGLKISLRDIFSASGCLRVIEKQGESTLMQILQDSVTL